MFDEINRRMSEGLRQRQDDMLKDLYGNHKGTAIPAVHEAVLSVDKLKEAVALCGKPKAHTITLLVSEVAADNDVVQHKMSKEEIIHASRIQALINQLMQEFDAIKGQEMYLIAEPHATVQKGKANFDVSVAVRVVVKEKQSK
jgi:hypothetical protein